MRTLREIKNLGSVAWTREELFEGRLHLVAPVVALVQGVHNDVFYPSSELAKYPASWNGIALPVFHPEDRGPANTPSFIEERSVGRLWNVRFDADTGSLVGEVWIDIDKAQTVAPEVLNLIRSGSPLEVSTGLFADDDGTPGRWGGEAYEATVINYRPDHLALLPGSVGACSWEDGCGVRANVRGTARTPSFDGVESTSWASVKKSFAAYRDAYYRGHGGRPDDAPSTVADASSTVRNWIASKTLLGEGSADDERDLMFFPAVNPGTDKLNEGALRAVISGRGEQAEIPAGAKRSAQTKARGLLNKHFDAELEDNESMAESKGMMEKVRLLVGDIAERLGLRVDETSHDELRGKLQRALDALDNAGWVHFIREVFDDNVVYEASGHNPSETGSLVPVSLLYKRGFIVDENGEVTLSDDTQEVREQKEYVPVSEVASAASNDGEKTSKENNDMKIKNEEARKTAIDALIACEDNRFGEDDRTWLNTLEDVRLDKLRANDDPPKDDPPKDDPPKDDPSKDDPPKDDPPKNDSSKNNPPKDNASKPQSVDDYIGDAPPEVQEVLRRSVARDKAIKSQLVDALVANDRCAFTKEELVVRDIKELENLVALARVEVDFSAASGGPSSNVDDDKVPDMPRVFPAKKTA